MLAPMGRKQWGAALMVMLALAAAQQGAVDLVPSRDEELMTTVVDAADVAQDADAVDFFDPAFSGEGQFVMVSAPLGIVDKQGRHACVHNRDGNIPDPQYWPRNKDLLIRRHLTVPDIGITTASVSITAHASVEMYHDGTAVTLTEAAADQANPCASTANFVGTLASLAPGPALFAFRVAGGTDLNFFDVKITGLFATATADAKPAEAYTWGRGYYGVLGSGSESNVFIPTTIDTTALGTAAPIGMALGVAHTVLLLSSGGVFAWGRGTEGQLGTAASGDFSESPLSLSGDMTAVSGEVQQIAAGSMHNLLLTASGSIYCLGYNDRGQCGAGSTDLSLATATVVDGVDEETFVMVDAKDKHTVAVSRDAGSGDCKIFEWGNGVVSPTFRAVTGPVAAVAAGSYHAAFIVQGHVYVWGSNPKGQLGLPGVDNTSIPTKIPALKQHFVVGLAAGSDNTFAITETGAVFAWGGNAYGKLGLGMPYATGMPTEVTALGAYRIKEVAAGMTTTLFLSDRGVVLVAGVNLRDGSHVVAPVVWNSGSTKYFAQVFASHLHFGGLTDPSVWSWASEAGSSHAVGTNVAPAVECSSVPCQNGATCVDGPVWTNVASEDGSVRMDTPYWADKCTRVPLGATMIRVQIGSAIDYFKPIPGRSFCEMLTAYSKDSVFQWSSDGKSWVVPKYHGSELNLGGSQEGWPQIYVAGDSRKYIPFWGTNDQRPGRSGGCCHTTLSSSAEWQRPITVSAYNENFKCTCTTGYSGNYCERTLVCAGGGLESTCTVQYKEYWYATIDGADMAQTIQTSEPTAGTSSAPRPLPAGWELVPGTMQNDPAFARIVVRNRGSGGGDNAAFHWGTECIVLDDGSAWSTRNFASCGSGQLVSGSGGVYSVASQKKRLLIRRSGLLD